MPESLAQGSHPQTQIRISPNKEGVFYKLFKQDVTLLWDGNVGSETKQLSFPIHSFSFGTVQFILGSSKEKCQENIALCPIPSFRVIIRKVDPADSSSWPMTSDIMRSAGPSQLVLGYVCDSMQVIKWKAMVSFPPVHLRHASLSYLLTSFQERRPSVNSEALSKMWGSFVPKSLVNELVIADWVVGLWGPQHSVCGGGGGSSQR